MDMELFFQTNTCSRWIAVIESFVPLLLASFITGVVFAKFARPHPSITLSDIFTVSGGENNKEMLVEVCLKTGKHDEKRLCYYELKTSRLVSPRPEIELIHIIDANCPFSKQTSDDRAHTDFVVILLASGLDDNLHDMVHKKP
ncbi:inward rectifier K channel (IRK-C) family protein [Phytophthora cinnamomi]|uniref:inward rectifier K channel (IRK-C) family protein n=1 Tax=Phytophthora cinnamomi TaxID=4785 RepID=UPI00355A0A70|nr:inward rectifier K channel (IRK-C) family protein [Phytophthora cinnamomi]